MPTMRNTILIVKKIFGKTSLINQKKKYKRCIYQ